MPSNLKKRVHARMAKTGESYETALRHVRQEEARDELPPQAEPAKTTFVPPMPGDYTGTPNLPPVSPSLYVQDGRVLPDDPSRPVVEMIDVFGDLDLNDLHRSHVMSTAFDDPAMPPGVKRVLTVGEYLDARAKQTGWRLESIAPGSMKFMGKTLNAVLVWRR